MISTHEHDDESSLYHSFTSDLQSSWDVEDEGEVRDLLNVEITRDGKDVILRQTNYILKLMETYAPDGVPAHFQSTRTPCTDQITAHGVCRLRQAVQCVNHTHCMSLHEQRAHAHKEDMEHTLLTDIQYFSAFAHACAQTQILFTDICVH